MSPRGSNREPAALAPEFVELIHAQRGHMSVRQRVAGADALLRGLKRSRTKVSADAWGARGEPRSAPLVGWGRAAAALVAVAAAVALVVLGARGYNRLASRAVSRLSYVLDGGHVAHGSVIDADLGSDVTVRFSDGSDVVLARGSHASVRPIEGSGARMAIVDGSAYVDIVHRDGARWLFDAGPFLNHGDRDGLSPRLGCSQGGARRAHGIADRWTLSGPLSDAALALRSGQHLTVRVRQRETLIREQDEGTPDTSSPGDTASVAVDSSPDGASVRRGGFVDGGGARARGSASATKPDVLSLSKQEWPQRLANGDFEAIVRQAERMGVEECLEGANSADLSALADAARYGRHDELARSALLAQRRRFSGGRAARDAAFLLGKLEETDHDPAAAMGWYDRYMREDAKGPYASDAL